MSDESITSLPDAVARYGAFPMPAGSEPQALSAAEIRLSQYGEQRGTYDCGAEKALHHIALDLRKELTDQRTYERRLREQHDLDVAEINRLRGQVAALLAERHTTNEALDDAVKELRRRETGPALPWAHSMSDHDLHGFLDDLVSAAMGRWRSEPEVPDRTVLADIEKVCADWRTPGVGSRLDGSEFDGVTVRLAEPETGGASGSGACKACGSLPEQWCPDCGCCQKGCFDGHVDNPCGHANAPWGAQ
jgi:hypothetical protein